MSRFNHLEITPLYAVPFYFIHRLLSFDSESVLSPSGVSTPLRYGIFSSFPGTTVVFDFHRLAGGQPHFTRSPLRSIPACFTTWLEEPGIVVLGADVAGDASVAGADATSCLDTRILFEHMRRAPESLNENPIVNVYGIGNKSGLGVQAYWGKGYNHKPQAESAYVRLYGSHRYFAPHSARLRWPWWRRATELYRWTRGIDGNLADVHHFYMWSDGTTPMALLHRAQLTLLIRNPWSTLYEDRSLTERLHHFISPYVRQPPAPRRRPKIVDLSRDDGELSDSSTDSDPPPPSVSRPVPLDWRPFSPEPAPPVAPVPVPPPPERTVIQMPVWGPTQEFKAAWDTVFRPGDRCSYCASDSHVFNTKQGRPACPRYHAGEVYTCQYKYCNAGTLHCTKMCPVLHAVCSTCYTRGHTEEQRCEEWEEQEWARRRDDWEAVADLGLYTQQRHRIWNHGFFYHRRFTAWPWPFESYLHLTSVPVLRVLAILRDWANGIAPLPPTRKRPAFHDEPHPRSRKRPPPEESRYQPAPALPPLARARSGEFFSGDLQPRPVHPVGSSLAAAPARRPAQQPPPAPTAPPTKRIKQAIVRQVPRVRQDSPIRRARRARSPTRAVIRPVPPRAVSVPPRPDFSRPPPTSTVTSGSPRLIVLPPLNVPPPPKASTPARRAPVLPLPPSPPRRPRSPSSSSSESEAVDLDIPSDDRLE